MPEHSSWRDLLRVIISNVAERARIAQQMGVHPMTLVRWAQGTSVPRSSNLRQLLQVLSPDARTQFSALLGQGCPLLYANRIASCLLFSCLQPEYFLSQTRRSLVEDLTRLTSLAFQPEEFYPPEAIELFVMPLPALQQRLLVSFRQRVIQLMKEASQTGSLLTITQAEELTWQQLEAELIELSCQQFSPETPEEKRKVPL